MTVSAFKFQGSEERIFRVFPVSKYTTIQAAIDAADAFLGGAGDDSNRAFVLVYNKGFAYSEDLTMKPGVAVIGVGSDGVDSKPVIISGSVTYTPTNSSPAFMQNIQCLAPVGKSALIYSGASAGRFVAENCLFNKFDADAANPSALISNTGSGLVELRNTIVNKANDGICVDITSNATVKFFDQNAGIEANGSAVQAARINSGSLELRDNKVAITSAQTGGDVVEFTGAGTLKMEGCGQSDLNGDSNFLNMFTGSIATLRNSIINGGGLTTTKFAIGTGTINLNQGFFFIGSFGVDRARAVDPTITVTNQETPGIGRIGNRFIVGDGRGYTKIQDAIDDAVSAGFGGAGAAANIEIFFGTYVENLTLPTNINLIGRRQPSDQNNQVAAFIEGEVLINGADDGTTILQGLSFTANASTKSALRFEGTGAMALKAANCEFHASTDRSFAGVKITNSSATSIDFRKCLFFMDGDTGLMFDIGAGVTLVRVIGPNNASFGPDFNQTAGTPSATDARLVKIAGNSSIQFSRLNGGFNSEDGTQANMIEFVGDNGQVSMDHCLFTPKLKNGEIVRYSGDNNSLLLRNTSWANFSQDSLAIMAREGTVATGSIEIINNVFDPGDKVTFARKAYGYVDIINNTFDVGDKVTIDLNDFEEGVDWSAGIDTDASAENLKTAINTAAIGISAFRENSRVWLFNDASGTAGNAKTLTKVDGATENFTLSGATLTGGLDDRDFEEGVDWNAGGSIAASAANLSAAINAINGTADPFADVIRTTIDPSNSGLILVQPFDSGILGNTITMAETDGGTNNFVLSGSTLTGGAGGTATGNGFEYGGCSFSGNSQIDSSIANQPIPGSVTST
jgi:hypothetical protein